MRSTLLIITILVSTPPSLSAQHIGALWLYAFPHEAEAIRLGGPYAAVGRGLASMHSNTAALGFQRGAQLQFSSGRGMRIKDAEFSTPYTMAAAVHIPDLRATVGIAINNDECELDARYTGIGTTIRDQLKRLGIHIARQMNDWLSLGVAVMRYEEQLYQSSVEIPFPTKANATAVVWDLSVSGHGRHNATFLGRPADEIRYGLTIDNLLGTEVWYIDEAQKDPLNQVLRCGAAYFWRPEFGQVLGADILSLLTSVETSVQGTRHEFRNWGTVGGAAELRVLDVFMLSAGIENIIRFGNGYDQWPAYPVLRYGAGLDVPLDRILNTEFPISVQIDYAHSQWNSRAERELYVNPYNQTQQVNSYSAQLRAVIF